MSAGFFGLERKTMSRAKTLTADKVREILSSEPKEGAYMRHNSRVVKPFELGLFELEDSSNDYYIIGSLNEAVEFLMNA